MLDKIYSKTTFSAQQLENAFFFSPSFFLLSAIHAELSGDCTTQYAQKKFSSETEREKKKLPEK